MIERVGESAQQSGAAVKFAFIIHPTALSDVERYEPGARGKGEPIVRKILSWMPPYLAAHLSGIETPAGRRAEGFFSAVPLLPEQMLDLPREAVYEKILHAITLAADQGARIVGLGAFTGIIGDGGVTIAERSPIPVTTGNSLTIAAAVQSVVRAAEILGRDPLQCTLAVTGATGSIGSACVELLGDRVARIFVTAPNATRLRVFVDNMQPRVRAELIPTTDPAAAVREAQLVLTASSATREIIDARDLQPGAAVCEISIPHNIGPQIAAQRPDVLFTEGGLLRMPGNPRWERIREPGVAFDMGLPAGSALACMSETMVLALNGRFEHYTLGRGIAIDRVREIDRLALATGFRHSELRGFNYAVSAAEIESVRHAARGVAAPCP